MKRKLPVFCPECGAANSDNAKFCVTCGASFRAYTPTEAPTREYTPVDARTLETPVAADRATGADLVGRTIDKYRITKKLGQGGMGTVFLAEHVALDQPRAIKILSGEVARNNLFITRFFKEAQSVAAIHHPNIVQVYDAGDADGYYFFAMEYVEGETFADVLYRRGPLPWREALEVIKQVLAAFKAAHGKGIIHRDIKPENIMRTEDGVVKVADFGLAKNIEETMDLTRAGHVMGTPSYMSPEQCQGEEIDVRADIYSLGATCYTMLAGRPMFRAETPLAVLQMHVSKEPEPIGNLVPDLPAPLAAIIHRMLEKNVSTRYQDAEKLSNAIDDFETTLTTVADAAAPHSSQAPHFSAGLKSTAAPLEPLRESPHEAEPEANDEATSKPPAPKKRSKVRLVIFFLVIILAAYGSAFVGSYFYEQSIIAKAEREKEARFNEFLTAAKQHDNKEEAKTAFGEINKALTLKPDDTEALAVWNSIAEKVGTFTNSIGMKFVRIPPGAFMMGSPENESTFLSKSENEAQHLVKITKPFYMQTTEVTQAQWDRIMNYNPSHFKDDNRPVDGVSWDDAHEFIRSLNEMEGGAKYRLPTEAEWEYACRAGTATPFCFGETITTDQANYDGTRPYKNDRQGIDRKQTIAVGALMPNNWGLYDMHGNVCEWCEDWYAEDYYYANSPVNNPKGPADGINRVFRGGAWNYCAELCRSAWRGSNPPSASGGDYGFRVCRSASRR